MSLLRDLIFAVSTIPSLSQVINIRFNEYNLPFVPDVVVPDLTVFYRNESYEPIVNAFFYLVDRSHRALGDRSVLAVELNDHPVHACDDVPVTSSIPLLDYFVLDTQQSGHLRDTKGPVTILRNTSSSNRDGILILNDTFDLEQFNQSCSSGSLARIPFRSNERYPADITLNANWPSTGRQITGITFYHVTWFVFSRNQDLSPGILDLPRPIANEIYEIIANSGAVLDQMNRTVSNCSMGSFINELPDVEISFLRMRSKIIVPPADYIVFDRMTNQCVLNFRRIINPSRERGNTWFFDPLALPNVNVHIVGNDLFICDAI